MKTAIVISDTHGNTALVDRIAPLMKEADYVFFLGDGERDVMRYYPDLKEKLLAVDGNCDIFGLGKIEGVVEIEGVRVLYCHGHKYGVKRDTGELFARAKELNCTLALYGHTHTAKEESREGITCLNPGCMTKFTTSPSYCYLVFAGGKVTTKNVELF